MRLETSCLARFGSIFNFCDVFSQLFALQVATDENGSKGYGFVHFETQESADMAIQKVNQMLLQDKKVYVLVCPVITLINCPARCTAMLGSSSLERRGSGTMATTNASPTSSSKTLVKTSLMTSSRTCLQILALF